MLPMIRPAAIVFDLDGTLADTIDGIAAAMNHLLSSHGHPTHAVDAYRHFVGDGAYKLMQRALPPDARDRAEDYAHDHLPPLIEEYGDRYTGAYDGIVPMLDALAPMPVKLAVLSNKPHRATRRCVEHLFGIDRFACVMGHRDPAPLKPDARAVMPILHTVGVQPRDAWCVGDSNVDMQLAINAGMTPIGAAWGFRGRAELQAHGAWRIIDHPRELLTLIGHN